MIRLKLKISWKFLSCWKFLENSGLLVKGVRETIQKEAKEQKGGFLSVWLGTLDGS